MHHHWNCLSKEARLKIEADPFWDMDDMEYDIDKIHWKTLKEDK